MGCLDVRSTAKFRSQHIEIVSDTGFDLLSAPIARHRLYQFPLDFVSPRNDRCTRWHVPNRVPERCMSSDALRAEPGSQRPHSARFLPQLFRPCGISDRINDTRVSTSSSASDRTGLDKIQPSVFNWNLWDFDDTLLMTGSFRMRIQHFFAGLLYPIYIGASSISTMIGTFPRTKSIESRVSHLM